MIYLLDANTLITGEQDSYPLGRFAIFWEWLIEMGERGHVKIPREMYDEIVIGKGDLVDWLKREDVKRALLLDEEADPSSVADVLLRGYGDLDENEVEQVGRDPFLVSYALRNPLDRIVVTFETSSPGKQRAKRKVPDVCTTFGVRSCTLYVLVRALDFTTEWRP